jgi:fucose 4-O-acetylase-like acetyltransferase
MAGAAGIRRNGIDTLRGLLVTGVILGHFFEITQAGSFATWIGAGVRMPLLIGLTGYLFNLERARAAPVIALVRRYYPRLILPWIVACLVHLTLSRGLDVATPVSLILWPPLHLWFVPVMMAFILVATVTRGSPDAMLIAAVPISIVAMYALGVGHLPPAICTWLPDRRFFIYAVYFFFGLWVARNPTDLVGRCAAAILGSIGFLWWCSLYDTPGIVGEVAAELIACLPLIALLPVVGGWHVTLPGITAIGRNSLFHYLWHPMIFALWRMCGVDGAPLLAVSLATLVVAQRAIGRHAALTAILGIAGHPSTTVARPRPFDTRVNGTAR